MPSGLCDNRGIERWLRTGFERMSIPNDFAGLRQRRGRELYITACNLDTAEREVFGVGERLDLTISEAVQASTALPLLYRPARIRGVEYVDGGVYRTANIDVAIEKGADLVVCYTRFAPSPIDPIPGVATCPSGAFRRSSTNLSGPSYIPA